MLQWDNQYELGIKTIDEQHKELFRIIGKLSDLLTNANTDDDIYDEMVEIIESITSYTVYHFRFEENLFEELQYAEKEKHSEEHHRLIEEIESLDLEAVDEDQISYGKKILKQLISWVFNHIAGSDFLYKELFLEKGIL